MHEQGSSRPTPTSCEYAVLSGHFPSGSCPRWHSQSAMLLSTILRLINTLDNWLPEFYHYHNQSACIHRLDKAFVGCDTNAVYSPLARKKSPLGMQQMDMYKIFGGWWVVTSHSQSQHPSRPPYNQHPVHRSRVGQPLQGFSPGQWIANGEGSGNCKLYLNNLVHMKACVKVPKLAMQTMNGKQYGFCLKMIGYCHIVHSTASFVAIDL